MTSHLVIVESPTKAKTIKRFLGKDFTVEASMGHVRDLPSSKLSVDTEGDFEPVYEVAEEKKTVIKNLQKGLDASDELWIATDEDREGEAIGWHLTKVLKRKNSQPIKRIVFHEITKEAIDAAAASPRDINMQLVEAQQARRVLDRLVGYTLSPFLWKKVYRGLSAGRVQSVAVRLIVDREKEIKAFDPVEYWTIDAQLETKEGEEFTASLSKKDGKKFVPGNEKESTAVVDAVKDETFTVANVEEKDVKKAPPAPFTTSTLQQEAGRKLGFSVKQTMVVAQQLYEGIDMGKGEGQSGLITYMRTDSVTLSDKALGDAKTQVEKQYGREYILSKPRTFKTKAKGAQEAHEAIRPTEMERTPESLKGVLDSQQLKLYTLVWNRTMATQMADAQLKRVGADIGANIYTFRATGQTVVFDGFLRVYIEGRDEEQDEENGKRKEESDGEKFLPALKEADVLKTNAIEPEQHFTKPPPRYTEASLVKKMEEEGIGRPSTYAPTISTIQARGYIKKENKQLVPEEVAFTVIDLLAEHFSDIVDLKFTAKMEENLDEVAEGSTKGPTFLRAFYDPFAKLVESKGEEVKKEDVMKERVLGKDPESGYDVIVRIGRFGPYVQLGRLEEMPEIGTSTKSKVKSPKSKSTKVKRQKPKSASLPKEKSTDEVTFEEAMSLLSFPRELGLKGEDMVTANLGRYGPYLRWGSVTVSLGDVDPSTVTLEEAETLIKDAKEKKKKAAEPLKTLGEDPNTKKEITVKDGRYGPYVTDGEVNASIPKRLTVEEVDLVKAVELLDRKRARAGKGPQWKKKS